MIAAAVEEVEKNSKVVEAVPLSIIPPDWNIASTTGGLLMLEKNEILNEKPKNPPRVHRLPKRFRLPFMLQKKNKKNFIQWTEEKKKMTQEEALLIDFTPLQRQEQIVKSGKLLFEFEKILWADRTAFYSMREGTWIENTIIDSWAVILNKEEAKSDSPRRIFFGVSSFVSQLNPYCLSRPELNWLSKPSMWWLIHDSFAGYPSMIHLLVIHLFCTTHSQDLNWLTIPSCVSSRDTISRYYQQGSNKEEIEFTFYERLGLELEEQGLTVASLLAAKANYPLHFAGPWILWHHSFGSSKATLHACFHIELVSAQYTFTEVMLPSHKDKTLNAEDCGIYTMHHMERYDGGEYEDGTTLDFNTGNIKEYWWKYMIKILVHPANKNKDKILEAMHQFYTNTSEEEQKEIPDNVDLSSKSYYNDRKIQGWVK
ncbi:OLC1v1009251C1 [Oldenlandia corymbosa var. corymbosa]|uniref:OLC1v1009251C1 n=1 Tax=Oldenlandia corymbosa var. corymbosa TaxID=529605 RepID=A0AAV1DNG6_OLDCO|nr:OLC1v1009251C1 [Oldenlandia corymbosa var. corymbosa]